MFISLYNSHPILTPVVGTWLFNNVVTAAVSSLPAPTRNSSSFYVWAFKFSNTVIGNISRASSTTVEKSPNWRDATANIPAGQGGQVVQNQPPTTP